MTLLELADVLLVLLREPLNLGLEPADGQLLELLGFRPLPLLPRRVPLFFCSSRRLREVRLQSLRLRDAARLRARERLAELRALLRELFLVLQKAVGEVEVPLRRRVVRRALLRELRRRLRRRAVVRNPELSLELRHRRVAPSEVRAQTLHARPHALVHARRRREGARGGGRRRPPLSDAFELDGAAAAETAAAASIDRSSSAPNAARRFSALRGVAAAETVPGLGMSTSARSRGARMAATDARTLNVGALRRRSVASAPASRARAPPRPGNPRWTPRRAGVRRRRDGKPRTAAADSAAGVFRLAPPGEGDRLSSAASNDASDAASATATASAAASTARRRSPTAARGERAAARRPPREDRSAASSGRRRGGRRSGRARGCASRRRRGGGEVAAGARALGGPRRGGDAVGSDSGSASRTRPGGSRRPRARTPPPRGGAGPPRASSRARAFSSARRRSRTGARDADAGGGDAMGDFG